MVPDLLDMMVKWIGFKCMEWEQVLGDQNVCCVIDCQGVTWSNMPFHYHSIQIALRAYNLLPDLVNTIIIYEASTPVVWFYSMIRPLMRRPVTKLLKLMDRLTITDVIAEENLPAFITGQVSETVDDFRPQVADDCLSFEEAIKFHGYEPSLYEKRVKKMVDKFVEEEAHQFPAFRAQLPDPIQVS